MLSYSRTHTGTCTGTRTHSCNRSGELVNRYEDVAVGQRSSQRPNQNHRSASMCVCVSTPGFPEELLRGPAVETWAFGSVGHDVT